MGGTDEVREERGLPQHSKAGASGGYVAAAAVMVTLQHLPLAPWYIYSSSCPKPGNAPAPFYRHRKVAEDFCNGVMLQVHGKTGNRVHICFLRLFMHSRHLCKLDVRIWMAHLLRALLEKPQPKPSHTVL